MYFVFNLLSKFSTLPNVLRTLDSETLKRSDTDIMVSPLAKYHKVTNNPFSKGMGSLPRR